MNVKTGFSKNLFLLAVNGKIKRLLKIIISKFKGKNMNVVKGMIYVDN